MTVRPWPFVLLCVGVVAAAGPWGVAAGADDPQEAVAEWDESYVNWASSTIDPCSATAVDICIDDAWISADGIRILGTPLVGGGGGWLYQFDTDEGLQTYWLAAYTTPGPREPGLARPASLSVRQVRERPPHPDGACPLPVSGTAADLWWCPEDLEPGLRFGITLRSPLRGFGWVDARMSDPKATFTPPAGEQPGRFTIEGAAMRVPTLRLDFNYANAQDRADWSRLVSVTSRDWGDSSAARPTDWYEPGPHTVLFRRTTPFVFGALARELPLRMRQASGWRTVWQAETSFVGEDYLYLTGDCVGVFQGLVQSNAMTYQEFVVWDDFTRELTFTMAGPHFDVDGTPLKGDFFMEMTDRAFECQWGGKVRVGDNFRVQVTNENGVESVAATTVTRRDGRIILRATNFGFSMKRATVTHIVKGAPAIPAQVRATARGSTVRLTWSMERGTSYVARILTGDAGTRRIVTALPVKKGVASIPGLNPGVYLLELIARNARGQSPPARATVTVR